MFNVVRLKEIFLSIGLLLLSTALLISGSGLMNTLVSLKFKIAGKSELLIGCIAAMYFSGMLFGSLKISKLIKIVGYVKSFSTLASIMAITSILPGMNDNIIVFFICRFIQGACIAGLYIVVESWVLCSSSENNRGKTLAMYMIVLYSSYSMGQFFLSEATISTILPFCISTILIIASIIPLSSFPVTPPLLEEHDSISLKKIYHASKAGFIGCFISGMIISSIFSILPLYVEEIADNTQFIAFAMAITFLSGVLMQYPLGNFSDKMDRRKVQIMLNIMYSIFLLIFAVLEYLKLVNYYVLIFIVIIIGIFSFTIYPVSMNLVCDHLKRSEIIRGTEGLTISFGVGSIIGPIYSSFSIKLFGFYGYPISYVILTIFLSCFSVFSLDKNKSKKQIPISEIITPLVPYNQIDFDSIQLNSKSKDKK